MILANLIKLKYNIWTMAFQMRTHYPEDNFLLVPFFIGAALFALGILAALFISLRQSASKMKSKTSGTAKRFDGNSKLVETEPVETQPEYFAIIGNHEIPIEKNEIANVKKQGVRVIQK
jgi:hypothetical protein